MARNAPAQNLESDFGGQSGSMNDFGFHGSVGKSAPKHKSHRDRSGPPTPMVGGSDSGSMNGAVPQMAHGGHVHPHGHSVHRVEQHDDGTVVHHHAHGGYTAHHSDGQVTHHAADGGYATGGPANGYAKGGHVMSHPHGHRVTHTESMHDREIHRHAHGGYTVHYHDGRPATHHGADGTPAYHGGGAADEKQDRAMVARGIHQHEDQEHGGKHSTLNLARGGHVAMPSMNPTMHKPRTKKPHMDSAMPINRPPRNPERSVSPRNEMPGGQMPYGVEPSAEPDVADSGAPVGSPGVGAAPSGGPSAPDGMRRGGRVKPRA